MIKINSAEPSLRSGRALSDVRDGFLAVNLWLSLAWLETKQRYRRSMIGPFWITLNLGIMVLGLGTIYSTLFSMDTKTYIPFLTAGLIVWTLISGLIADGCMVFINSEGMLKQLNVPLSIYILKSVLKNYIILFHNLIVYALAVVYYETNVNSAIFILPLSLFIIMLNGISFSFILGILCVRFRDLQSIVMNILQVIFFITPIMWNANMLGRKIIIAYLNPIYYLLELVRSPLTGTVPSINIWLGCIVITALNATIATLLFVRFRGRITYWL